MEQFQAQIRKVRAENEDLRRSLEEDRAALLAHYEPIVAGLQAEIQRLTLALAKCEADKKSGNTAREQKRVQLQDDLNKARDALSDLQRKIESERAEYERRIRACESQSLSISVPRSQVPSYSSVASSASSGSSGSSGSSSSTPYKSVPSPVPSSSFPYAAPSSAPLVPSSVPSSVPSTPTVSISLPSVSGGNKTLQEYCTDDRITKQQLAKPYRDWTQKQLDSECKHITRIRNKTLKGGKGKGKGKGNPQRRVTQKHRQKETKA